MPCLAVPNLALPGPAMPSHATHVQYITPYVMPQGIYTGRRTRMDIIRKDATITNTDDAGPGSFEVVLSAPTLDRDGDTLKADEWKQPLPDHITFDIDHGMSVASTVGSGAPHIDDEGRLIVAGSYSSLPRAQEVRTLVNEGHIKTTSVAFMTEKTKKDGKEATVRELLNGAFVAVPSNREALVLASKGIKAGARNSSADAAMIQDIHDKTASLGADCSGAKAITEADVKVKSVEGSLEAAQDRVRDALEDAYPDKYAWLRATLPDYIVFELAAVDGPDSDTLKQSYTDDGSVVTLTGDATPVDLAEVVKPDPDEITASDPSPAPVAPAKAASTPTDADQDNAEIQVRAAHIRALQRIANAS